MLFKIAITGFFLVLSGVVNASGQSCTVHNDDATQINLGVAVYEPWMIAQGKKVSGIDVDIVKEIARRININVNMIQCNWTECIERSKNGSVDLLTNLFRTTEREEYLHFINPPYLTGTNRMFYALGTDKYVVTNFDDLRKLRIGAEKNVLQFDKFDNNNYLQKRYYDSSKMVLKALLEGEVDVVVGQESVFDFNIENDEQFKGRITQQRFFVYSEQDGYFGISKCNRKDTLWRDFEKHLVKVINEGFVAQSIKRYK